jgi:hypothetical protein
MRTRRPQVAIVTYTAGAAEALRAAIAAVPAPAGETPIVTIATIGDDAAWPAADGLTAVVLAVESAGLRDSRYVEALRAYVGEVTSREDFRLYAWSPPAAAEASPLDLFADLMDSVHIPSTADPGTIAESLAGFVACLPAIRRMRAWRALRAAAIRVGARVAAVVQLLCLGVALATAIALPVWDTHPVLDPFAPYVLALAVASGIAAVPLLSICIFAFSRYGVDLLGMHRYRHGRAWAAIGTLVAPPVTLVPFRLQAPWRTIVLAYCAGGLVDIARRRGLAARLARRRIDVSGRTPRGEVPSRHLLRDVGTTLPNPLALPMLTPARPAVFVSYARSSAWGSSASRTIRDALRGSSIETFRDLEDLPPGASWRRELGERIGRATTVVCLVDRVSVERDWPAVELEMAVTRNRRVGAPSIVLVIEPELVRDASPIHWLPIFRVLLERLEVPRNEGDAAVVEWNDATTDDVLRRIDGAARFPPSVVPRLLENVAGTLWRAPRFLLRVVSAAAPAGAYVVTLAIVLTVALAEGDPKTLLTRLGLAAPLLLLTAVWLGSLARLACAAYFETSSRRNGGLVALLVVGATSQAGLAWWIADNVSTLVLAWGAVATAMAWTETAAFLHGSGWWVLPLAHPDERGAY